MRASFKSQSHGVHFKMKERTSQPPHSPSAGRLDDWSWVTVTFHTLRFFTELFLEVPTENGSAWLH